MAGTLDVNDVSGDRVIFSSNLDDSVGGDTNGDGGATTPGPGDWRGVVANVNSEINVAYTDLRYAGNASYAPIYLNGTGLSVTLSHCVISDALRKSPARSHSRVKTNPSVSPWKIPETPELSTMTPCIAADRPISSGELGSAKG